MIEVEMDWDEHGMWPIVAAFDTPDAPAFSFAPPAPDDDSPAFAGTEH